MNYDIFLVAAGAIQLAYDEMIKNPGDITPNGRAMRQLLSKTHTGDNYDWLYMEYLMERFREIAGLSTPVELTDEQRRIASEVKPVMRYEDGGVVMVEHSVGNNRYKSRVPAHITDPIEAMAWVWMWIP